MSVARAERDKGETEETRDRREASKRERGGEGGGGSMSTVFFVALGLSVPIYLRLKPTIFSLLLARRGSSKIYALLLLVSMLMFPFRPPLFCAFGSVALLCRCR